MCLTLGSPDPDGYRMQPPDPADVLIPPSGEGAAHEPVGAARVGSAGACRRPCVFMPGWQRARTAGAAPSRWSSPPAQAAPGMLQAGGRQVSRSGRPAGDRRPALVAIPAGFPEAVG